MHDSRTTLSTRTVLVPSRHRRLAALARAGLQSTLTVHRPRTPEHGDQLWHLWDGHRTPDTHPVQVTAAEFLDVHDHPSDHARLCRDCIPFADTYPLLATYGRSLTWLDAAETALTETDAETALALTGLALGACSLVSDYELSALAAEARDRLTGSYDRVRSDTLLRLRGDVELHTAGRLSGACAHAPTLAGVGENQLRLGPENHHTDPGVRAEVAAEVAALWSDTTWVLLRDPFDTGAAPTTNDGLWAVFAATGAPPPADLVLVAPHDPATILLRVPTVMTQANPRGGQRRWHSTVAGTRGSVDVDTLSVALALHGSSGPGPVDLGDQLAVLAAACL